MDPNYVEDWRRRYALRPESDRRLNSIRFRKGSMEVTDHSPARLLPVFNRPKHLDYGDVSKLSGGDQTLLTTLQGIVNRTEPELYFIYDTGTQSVPDANITAQGYGKTHPIADNSTNSGRAQNRRVELVVSGNAIGVQEQQPGASSDNQPAPAAPPAQPGPSGFVGNVPQNPTGTSHPPQR